MLKFFISSAFLFSAVSFYVVSSQKDKPTSQKNSLTSNKDKLTSKSLNISKRKLASQRPAGQYSKDSYKTSGTNYKNPQPITKKIKFQQWSNTVKAQTGINSKNRKKYLKNMSPSELMGALRQAEALPKAKRMQALRITARRFIPESLLFYLAGNLVSLTDHGFGISEIENPRFFKTELDHVLSLEGGAHFFSFIFFNQMYSLWSQKKIQSGTASVALNKFLKSAKNAFAGMAVAGLGASIVSDLGSMIYHCGLNDLQKVEKNQASDIFATPADHFAACDNLYLGFVSGQMQAGWINQLALGLIPAAVLSHGVSAAGKQAFQKASVVKKWLETKDSSSVASHAKKAQSGKLALAGKKIVSGARVLLSSNWIGALVNFSLFVGMERFLTSYAAEWGSKKINLGFLTLYKSNLKKYFQKGLGSYSSIKDLENNQDNKNDTSVDQCATQECIQNYYINQPTAFSAEDFLDNLKLYSKTFRDRRQLLLSRGQMQYQNWITSIQRLTFKYEASFQFYSRFIQEIASKSQFVKNQLVPLVYILPNKNQDASSLDPLQFAEESNGTVISLSKGQRQNLSEALIFLNERITEINRSSWFLSKKELVLQLRFLKRQLFSENLELQLLGFKNLQTLAKHHRKKFYCGAKKVKKAATSLKKEFPRSKNLTCTVVQLYNQLGSPQSKTYLEAYMSSWVPVLESRYGKELHDQPYSKNLVEDFLLSMVCGKEEGEIFSTLGLDKEFYSPKIVNLKNISCRFHSIKTPPVHMLCDAGMGNETYNINLAYKEGTGKSLAPDFQCAKLWGMGSYRSPRYSVMSSYFAVNTEGDINTYNNLAELVVRHLSKKFLTCDNETCRQQLAQAATEAKDLSVFEIWWIKHIDPYVLKKISEAEKEGAKVIEQQIFPVLYNSALETNNFVNLSIPQLLSKNVSSLSVVESLENESLVYQKIIKNIYKKYCTTEVCLTELNQWFKDVRFNLKQILQVNNDLDEQAMQKVSKNLEITYHNLFYTLVPSPTATVKYYFQNINKSFKVTDFEKAVLTQSFKALNAQLFELSAYRSLLLERK